MVETTYYYFVEFCGNSVKSENKRLQKSKIFISICETLRQRQTE